MEKQYRYPGTRPFLEDDRNLFFGRNEDIEKLTELIVLEKLVVLFSKSGYGKSSLLNAGVIPRLKEIESFQTLNIRFNDPERNPVELLSFHLEKKIEQSTFLDSKFNIPVELPDDISAKLWYYSKSIQLTQEDARELVLIFDQFEELFNYSPTQVKDFASELAKLTNPNLIASVRGLFKQKIAVARDYYTKEETDLLLEPLHLKVVFSMRSDRISLLNQLKDSIPAVFKKTYELQPLNEAQSKEALQVPAGKEGDYISPKFSFSMDVQERILNSLIDKEKRRIETFQLQLICQHAEEKIIQKQKDHPNSGNFELTAAELGNPEDIFENHYNTIIATLPAESQLKARILIEDKLIIGGNRVPLPESVIIEEHQVSADLLLTLVDKRLLRSEPNTVGGMSFELSHDTLVAPIQKTAKIRRVQEAEERAEMDRLENAKIQRKLRRTRILLGTAVFALVSAVIAFFVAIDQRNNAKNQAMISKGLLLASNAKNLLLNGKRFQALRIAEAAYQTALEASTQPPPPILAVISDSFNHSGPTQLGYFEGHEDILSSIAFSPNGKFILTGSWDKKAFLWNLEGKTIQTFEGHEDGISSVSFAPDGNSILTGSWDKTAILWDLEGKQIQTFEGHRNSVYAIAYSPDGKTILTGSRDKTAILWDLEGKQIQTFEGHENGISSVSFSPEGNSILTGSWDKTAILWDLEGKQIQKFEKDLFSVNSVAFSPDGKSILTGSDWGTPAILWNIKGKQIQKFMGHQQSINSVAFSPDGKSILTGSSDNTAILWDLEGKQIITFEGHQNSVYSAAYSPDGKSILTGSRDKTVILWDIEGKQIITFEGHESGLSSVAFSPNGNSVLTGSFDNTAILWDIKGKMVRKFEKHKGLLFSVAFSPDGKLILTGSSDKTAILWDINGKEVQKFEGHKKGIFSVAFSPDGESILTGSSDNTAILWDVEGKQIKTFKGHKDGVSSVTFSPEGNFILTGSWDNTAILWGVNGKQIKTFEGHNYGVYSIAYSPDGKSILTGSRDKTAILWNIDGKQIKKFEGHQESINSVAFSPDGKFILTGSMDNTVILWDIGGKQIKNFEGHLREIESVAFSPDGNSILTGSRDKTAIIWKTPIGVIDWLQSPDCSVRQLTEEEKVRFGIIEAKE